jgi:hypothetical protein
MGIGLSRGACETALEFCRQTPVGARRLLDYQEVQSQLADMVAAVRSMRSALWQMARYNRRPRQLEAALCKFHFTDLTQQACEQALQLISNDQGEAAYLIDKVLRDGRLTRIFEGTNQINRLALIEDLRPGLLRCGTPTATVEYETCVNSPIPFSSTRQRLSKPARARWSYRSCTSIRATMSRCSGSTLARPSE